MSQSTEQAAKYGRASPTENESGDPVYSQKSDEAAPMLHRPSFCPSGRVKLIAALLTACSCFGIGLLVGGRLAGDQSSNGCERCEAGPITHCGPNDQCTRSFSERNANGLIFIGLSLSRNHFLREQTSHNMSVSRQMQFDFNQLQDRRYQHICSTNDDGWLVGGGEGDGSSTAWKIAAKDSAHIEVVHIGNGDVSHGGLTEEMIVEKMKQIRFKPITLRPSYFAVDSNNLPEIELRFADEENPELLELQEKTKQVFQNPSVSFPDHFHMSIARKVLFYSRDSQRQFLQGSDAVVQIMRDQFPDGVVLQPDPRQVSRGAITQEEVDRPGGVYLFWGRNDVRQYFPPTI